MRDAAWLHQRLDSIWDTYFADVPQENIVRIEWGRKAKTRLGSIRLDRHDLGTTIITINRLYQDELVPEYVVDATIAHELTHYAHGFNSPREQQRRHPHAGGVMKREFAERGMEHLYTQQHVWLKANWAAHVARYFGPQVAQRARRRTRKVVIPPFFRW